MSYDVVNPTYYQTFQPGTPFHPGAPGWTQAPFPTWGDNPNLSGRRRLATDGLGRIVAISGLGAFQLSDKSLKCPSGTQRIDRPDGSAWCATETELAAQRAVAPPPATSTYMPAAVPTWLRALSMASAAASAYHGYKRNESVGWAFGWALFGSALPIIALPVALAQGFGRPKKMASNRRRRRRTRR